MTGRSGTARSPRRATVWGQRDRVVSSAITVPSTGRPGPALAVSISARRRSGGPSRCTRSMTSADEGSNAPLVARAAPKRPYNAGQEQTMASVMTMRSGNAAIRVEMPHRSVWHRSLALATVGAPEGRLLGMREDVSDHPRAAGVPALRRCRHLAGARSLSAQAQINELAGGSRARVATVMSSWRCASRRTLTA